MNRSLILSVCLAIFATIWVLSGSFSSSEESNSDDQANAQAEKTLPAFKVKVQKRTAQTMQDEILLQGEVNAERKIEIRAETDGVIKQLFASKGDKLKEGDSILSLAMNDRKARLARAKADLRVRQTELVSSKSLRDKNMISENQYQQNIANVVAAQAEVEAIDVEIKQTNITAAFNGVLNDLHVELGDYVSQGTSLATLVDQDWVSLTTQVPQQHIAKMEQGQIVEATLLDGTKLRGKVNYISSSADLATRTFLIEARAENLAGLEYFGQSARIRIMLGERLAHRLSPSLLNLSSDGGLQVKTIDQDKRVVNHNVRMIRSDNDGIWLSGLPETIDLITVGQGFVSEGEVVEPIYETFHAELNQDASVQSGDSPE